MKDSLEYKMLKYLSENGKNSFISLDNFIEDKDILRLKLKSLKKDSLIDVKRIRTGDYSTKSEYMINGKGLIYLNKLKNNVNKKITNNFNNNTIGQLIQDSNFSNNPITNNTIQNPKSELKTNSPILKFWKLISENKLISSFILALVLFAIKKIFHIEL